MKRFSIVLILLTTAVGTASAATWYVYGNVMLSGNGKSPLTPFKSIQEGIDAASDGDTVRVEQATYYERISFNGNNIVVKSTNPADTTVRDQTIIDGNKAGSVVRFSGTEQGSCILSGFTIRNGRTNYWAGGIDGQFTFATIVNNLITGNHGKYGGGISSCAGLIQNNTITRNSADFGGGLIFCMGTIRRNKIRRNTANLGAGVSTCSGEIVDNDISDNTANRGGGLAFCVATIRGNDILANEAQGANAQGGGLLNCHGEILDNIIQNNVSDGHGGGLAGCDVPITGNTINSNYAIQSGGGLYSCGGIISNNIIRKNGCGWSGGGLAECHGTIEKNTITGNYSLAFGAGINYCNGAIRSNVIAGNIVPPVGHGGGLAQCTGTIENNTIVGNLATKGGGLYDCDGVVQNCILWANTAEDAGPQLYSGSIPTYSCIHGWTGGGQGNTAIFPLFVDPDGPDDDVNTYNDNNYRLSWSHLIPSACIDKGKNETWMQGATDRDGNPRIYYGLSSMKVDMGAYEYGSWKFKIAKVAMIARAQIQLSWPCRAGDKYVVLSTRTMRGPGLIPPPWKREATLTAVGRIMMWTDPDAKGSMKFYRIEELH